MLALGGGEILMSEVPLYSGWAASERTGNKLEGFSGLLHQSPGQRLALTVLCVLHSLGNGQRRVLKVWVARRSGWRGPWRKAGLLKSSR